MLSITPSVPTARTRLNSLAAPTTASTKPARVTARKTRWRSPGRCSFAVTGIDVVPTWVQFGSYRVLAAGDPPPGVAAGTTTAASHRRTLDTALSLEAPGVSGLEAPFPEVTCAGVRASIVGSVGDDVILGTPGDDVLRGTREADQIRALAGSDLVYARGAGDELRLGAGDDRSRAGEGADVAYGGRGNDFVGGGDGSDRLFGGSGEDRVWGGDGEDRVAGNQGDDRVAGGDGADSLFGGWGSDRLFGGRGDDVLHALAPDGQPDALHCGRGDDRAVVLRSERPLTRITGCERLELVVILTADQEAGENADTDAEADG